MAQLVVLTVLAPPHLLTYDLILLTLPLIVFADWTVTHRGHPARGVMTALCLLLYLAPFSANLARVVPIQLSVLAMAAAAYYWPRAAMAASWRGAQAAGARRRAHRWWTPMLTAHSSSDATTSMK